MSHEETNRLKYTIALVAEFARKYGIAERQAYNYMYRFKGTEYLSSFYDVLHTQSFEDAIEAVSIVCKRNGGQLNYSTL
jgi:hypothetical protein